MGYNNCRLFTAKQTFRGSFANAGTAERVRKIVTVRRVLALCFTSLLILALRLPAHAAGGFFVSLSKEEGKAGETIGLTVSYDGSLGEIGAFHAQILFDSGAAEYQGVSKSAALSNAYTVTQAADGVIDLVYVQKESPVFEAGELFTFRFQIADDVYEKELQFYCSILQIVSPDGVDLGDEDEQLTLSIAPAPSEEASLLSLIPSAGELVPAFSPNQFDYALSVPFEVTTLTFTAEAAEGASWKVNRKNLGAGGSDTEFFLTVTAQDGKTKAQYQVTVHREEKAGATETPTPTPKPAAAAKPTATPKPAGVTSTKTPKPTAAPKPTKTPKPAEEKAESKGAPAETPTLIYQSGNPFTLSMALVLTAVVVGQAIAPAVTELLREKVFKRKRGEEKQSEADEDEIDDS